jgi:hypothetical protein
MRLQATDELQGFYLSVCTICNYSAHDESSGGNNRDNNVQINAICNADELTSLMLVPAISMHYTSSSISAPLAPLLPLHRKHARIALPAGIAYFMSFICFNSCHHRA